LSETGRRKEFISTSLGFQFSESVSRYAEEEVSFPRSFSDVQATRSEVASQQFSAHTDTNLARTEAATEQSSGHTDQAGTRTESQQIINT
jgi:hypothetical protein